MQSWGFAEAADYLLFVAEKRADERLLQRWLMHYEDKISFAEFKQVLAAGARPSVPTPVPVIEADVSKICKMKVEG
jgi:hypothetical protein